MIPRILACLLGASFLLSIPAFADEPSTESKTQFLRVVENNENSNIALEIATRWYRPKSGKGPSVALVGVSHIGDHVFYDDLQKLLDSFEVVLYETVRPAGAAIPEGKTDQERRDATEHSLHFLATIAETQYARQGNYPDDFDALAAFALTLDPRLGQWAVRITHDAWQHPLLYLAENKGASFTLTSFGADGLPKGDGPAADIVVSDRDELPAIPTADEKGDGNIQSQLASALDLAFQLEALDYSRPHFRGSDMTIDQVERAFQDRGEDFSLVGDMLAGSSLPAKIISLMLRLMKWFDTMMEGAIADTFKVVLIELLGDESVMELSTAQFGNAFSEVIIGERNQVVIDDLAHLVKTETGVKSVAIFYGAAHLPDMEKRLVEQLGYESTDRVNWNRAVEVDLKESAVSKREVAQVRLMIRRMIRQMQKAAPQKK